MDTVYYRAITELSTEKEWDPESKEPYRRQLKYQNFWGDSEAEN